jgi:hypothetical protein
VQSIAGEPRIRHTVRGRLIFTAVQVHDGWDRAGEGAERMALLERVGPVDA